MDIGNKYWFWDKNDIDNPYSITIIQTDKLSSEFLKDEVTTKTRFGDIYSISTGKLEAILMKMKKNSFDQKYLFKLLDIDRVKDRVD